MRKLFQMMLWIWISSLLHVSTLVHGLDPSTSADVDVKAALVTLVDERDLPALLTSMHQLEDRFNGRYKYDWIIFSTNDLSEGFKIATSNATNAACIYEVIPHENWNVPSWIESDRLFSTPVPDMEVELDPSTNLMELRRKYRWNSGLFAHEKRLRDYDWFWRVEPGAKLTHDIQFDVFRFMRDNNIAFGFHRDAVTESSLRILSPRVKAFIEKYPELLHEEADISWLLDSSSEATSKETTPSSLDLGIVEDDDDDNESDDMVSSLAEVLTSWLSGIYESSLYPTFEIGSLAFFRSTSHKLFFDHLDSAGDFYYHTFKDIPVHTLSATLFLPRQSVLNLRKREGRYRARHEHRPSQPKATPDPDKPSNEPKSATTESAMRNGNANVVMHCWLEVWDVMARDLERQEAIPGLRSGNTVIDERNFALV